MFKIIFVDDEFLVLEGLKRIIDWNEFDIEIAGTAQSAIEGLNLIKQKNPDIVITDIRMRGMDGLDMIRHAYDGGYSGYTIILSGHQDFEYARRAIESRVYRYLLKPIDVKEMKETVKKIVDELNEKNSTIGSGTNIFEHVVNYINSHFNEDIQLSKLAKKYNFELTHFSKSFKKKIGVNYVDYVLNLRVTAAKKYLTDTDMSVEEIAERIGYRDVNYFREIFKKNTGMTPSEYKKGKRNDDNDSSEKKEN